MKIQTTSILLYGHTGPYITVRVYKIFNKELVLIKIIYLIPLLFSSLACSEKLLDRSKFLDVALEKQDYQNILTTLYPYLINKNAQLSEQEATQDLTWLKSKSELGHVPLYYFLSWKLIKTDILQSRKFNAMGRIGVMLYANECIRSPQYSPLYIALEGRVIENNTPLRDDNAAWAVAVNEALSWYKLHPDTPSAIWHCGNNNMLEHDVADAKRASYWQKIKVSNDADLPHN